tara:strand:- start:44 stop:313 length:270 start_codon:yes stop_codon:yes gene_type:complete
MKNSKLLIVLLSVLLVSLSGCSDPKGAKGVLDSAGYSEVKTHGADLFTCGQDDFYSTKFTAKNPTGKNTSGTVCSGLFFKGGTIRHQAN